MTTETKKPRAKKTAPAITEPVAVTAYKGFDKNLQCRGYQYEVGKTYTHTGKVVQCESGFHACQNPLDVLDYYHIGDGNRFAKVTLSGKIDRSDDRKWAAGVITIDVELRLPNLIADAVKWIMAACKGAGTVDTGDYSQLAASGNSSKLAASGNSSKLAASGYSSQLAASGYSSQLAASGDYSQLAASGNSSKLAASGNSSKLAASGNSSQLEVTGAKSAAAAVGNHSRIKAAHGTPIAVCEYDNNGAPVRFVTGITGVDGVPADTWLKAKNGNLVEA
jgi:hypothetical protein